MRPEPSGRERILSVLPGARGIALERVAIRRRESGATLSAWRLDVISDRGAGAVVLVEREIEDPIYRGEGVMLGWEQDLLAAAYAALRPGSDEPPFETMQLG